MTVRSLFLWGVLCLLVISFTAPREAEDSHELNEVMEDAAAEMIEAHLVSSDDQDFVSSLK